MFSGHELSSCIILKYLSPARTCQLVWLVGFRAHTCRRVERSFWDFVGSGEWCTLPSCSPRPRPRPRFKKPVQAHEAKATTLNAWPWTETNTTVSSDLVLPWNARHRALRPFSRASSGQYLSELEESKSFVWIPSAWSEGCDRQISCPAMSCHCKSVSKQYELANWSWPGVQARRSMLHHPWREEWMHPLSSPCPACETTELEEDGSLKNRLIASEQESSVSTAMLLYSSDMFSYNLNEIKTILICSSECRALFLSLHKQKN